ncbi:MAG: BtdhL [uncultured bacterium]|nr:MAG: BtdhL [uncultured bacterium]OHE26865.1 MAG: hypothetical protein A3J94_09675 [Syntrophus sp. RIFOXYC2_FULL_54_9]HBB18720.1 NAD(P)-dependent oxidoreductase [Syntrophus sp. (in: bacteria)]
MSAAHDEKIGFIGLGNMGKGMAGRLLDAGFPLTVYDVATDRAAAFSKRGAKVAGSIKELAQQSEIIIAAVPDDAVLQSVVLGDNGVMAGAREGSILIVESTVSPKCASEVAAAVEKQGVKMLRAPVMGNPTQAAAGALIILVSGDKQSFEKCEKVFTLLGQKVHYVGANEEGLYIKLVHNMIVAGIVQSMAEAFTFGEKAGLDKHRMIEIISDSPVSSVILRHRGNLLDQRNFNPAFHVWMLRKDIDFAINAGYQVGSPMPTTALIRQFLNALEATGRGELDCLALALLMEEQAGIKH